MNVEVINTGTELLLGRIANSHLVFFGHELFLLGLRIARQTTVPDSDAIRDALAESFPRSEIIFITGGLGPTSDDLTRDIVAELLERELRLDEKLLAEIESLFTSRGKTMPPNNARQAQVPDGAIVLPNPHGSAPGLYLSASTANPHLFLLPGPPRELQPMFANHVAPILKKIAPRSTHDSRIYRIAKLGESHVEQLVGASLTAIAGLELGYCAHPGEVEIRCIGTPEMLAQADAIIAQTLGEHLISNDDRNLESVIVAALANRQATLALAESCTGGLLAHRITNVAGASAVFHHGLVTYSAAAKSHWLKIDPALIAKHNAVSEPVARAMAENLRAISGATFSLTTTGFAGPGGGTAENPVGTVFIGLATPREAIVERHTILADRETFKLRASQTALDLLRRNLR